MQITEDQGLELGSFRGKGKNFVQDLHVKLPFKLFPVKLTKHMSRFVTLVHILEKLQSLQTLSDYLMWWHFQIHLTGWSLLVHKLAPRGKLPCHSFIVNKPCLYQRCSQTVD